MRPTVSSVIRSSSPVSCVHVTTSNHVRKNLDERRRHRPHSLPWISWTSKQIFHVLFLPATERTPITVHGSLVSPFHFVESVLKMYFPSFRTSIFPIRPVLNPSLLTSVTFYGPTTRVEENVSVLFYSVWLWILLFFLLFFVLCFITHIFHVITIFVKVKTIFLCKYSTCVHTYICICMRIQTECIRNDLLEPCQ